MISLLGEFSVHVHVHIIRCLSFTKLVQDGVKNASAINNNIIRVVREEKNKRKKLP